MTIGQSKISDVELIKYLSLAAEIELVTVLLLAGTFYLMYYLSNVVHKPVLIASNEFGYCDKLRHWLSDVDELVWPTFWCFPGLLQTILCDIAPSPKFEYHREYMHTPDGGVFSLDWFVSESQYLDDKDISPVVFMLPGATGHSEKFYMQKFIAVTKELEFRPVVFNNRGLGSNMKLKTPYFSCVTRSADIEQALCHIDESFPGAPVIILAISIGGTMVVNYLSRKGRDISKNLIGGFIASVPWNAFVAKDQLAKPVNFLINAHMTSELQNILKSNEDLFLKDKAIHNLPVDMADIMQARTIWDFDDRYTCRMYGYNDHVEYYADASMDALPLEHITIPMLCLNAEDDPLCTRAAIPIARICKNPFFGIIITKYGGHVGFFEGLCLRWKTLPHRLFKDFARMLVNDRMRDLSPSPGASHAASLAK